MKFQEELSNRQPCVRDGSNPNAKLFAQAVTDISWITGTSHKKFSCINKS